MIPFIAFLILSTGTQNIESIDDPKILSILNESSIETKSPEYFPNIEISWVCGVPFRIDTEITENVFSLYAFPYSKTIRIGVNTEVGVLKEFSGGHLTLGLSIGIQKALPFHFYMDLTTSAGGYAIDIYGSTNIYPLIKYGIRAGAGTGIGSFHVSAGFFIDQGLIYMESRIMSTFMGLEIRVGM
ncbi:MAG: hypothetical protein JXR95_16150 [Deltaproteobacteria bacterium]|nr:hypothetical protein [Deltaproteobacteria bacterium]